MGSEITPNRFRAAVLRGEEKPLIVTAKTPMIEVGPGGVRDALGRVVVPRSETRRANHRGVNRHRLSGESAAVRWRGKSRPVEIVNLSSGGAMIRGEFSPRLWDLIELRLGEGPGLEGAVRWLKDDCIGVEFAHETCIDCDPEQRASVLLEAIKRSFPDQHIELESTPECGDLEVTGQEAEPQQEDLGNRDVKRHPLIWVGEIHYDHESKPVRLRNISESGALIDISTDYPADAEVLLDLGEAGQAFATVKWTCGSQAGLHFLRPFDLHSLAKARPEVTPHSWSVPTFLDRNVEDDSAWHERWNRSSIAEIRNDLEGFLKR